MIFAKKSLGQNFLKSEKALKQIVEEGKLSHNETVLEIGPGLGALTQKLIQKGVKVIAVEKDDALFSVLKEKFAEEIKKGNLTLIHEDIIKFDANFIKDNYKLIANIPYNITGRILEKFFSLSHKPTKIVVLVQKEVAQRIVAKDGKESVLSISVKVFGTPKYVDTVFAGSFVPAPKVDSAILAIDSISKKFFTDINEQLFFKVLKAGFSSKRKKLSSNLSIFAPKEEIEYFLKEMGVDPSIRPENITPQNWKIIAQKIISFGII